MSIYTRVTSVLALFIFASTFSFAQFNASVRNPNEIASDSTDYFRTKTSGYWHEPSTWETSADNQNWSDATLAPHYSSKGIVVRSEDTVYVLKSVIVDQLVVDSSAVLMLNSMGADTNVVFSIRNGVEEKDMIVYGTVIATGVPPQQTPFTINPAGNISFEDGSFYVHDQNAGGIPVSIWEKGSTFKLTGTIDIPPANRGQSYSNIVVDLPKLTIHLNMNFWNNVISGDIDIIQTAGESRWVLVGPQENEVRELTILGNINQYGGNFNTHGTENPNSTAIINVYGDINVQGGNFSIARGSQGGTGTTTWYLHGDLSMSNAATLNANPAGAKFVFVGEKEHKLTLNNVNFLRGGLPIEVDNTSLDLGTTVLKGEGMFAVRPGSIITCAHIGGLDSSLQNTGMTEFTIDADYVFNGTSQQVTGVKLPYGVRNLTVNNSSGVYLSGDVIVSDTINVVEGNLLLNGHTVTLGENAEIIERAGYVTGTSGKITTTRVIDAPDKLNIGGMGVILTSAANLDTTFVEVMHNPVYGINSIYRTYYLLPKNNSNLNATVRLTYIEPELDTMSENNLKIFKSYDGLDSTWQIENGIINTEDNYVEMTGVESLTYYTLAYGSQVVSVNDDELNGIPSEFSLYQNYPNPFNPETKINFDLPEDSFVDISVYNIIGEKVMTILASNIEKGRHSRIFNASSLPSGIYIYKLSAGSKVFTKKMMLLK